MIFGFKGMLFSLLTVFGFIVLPIFISMIKEGYFVSNFYTYEEKLSFIRSVLHVIVLTDKPESEFRNKALISTLKDYKIEFSKPSLVDLQKLQFKSNLKKSQIQITKLLYSTKNECKKKYCMIIEDDFYFIQDFKKIIEALFKELLVLTSNDKNMFDCSKRGFFQREYDVNGNTLACRIIHYKLLTILKQCIDDMNEINVEADELYKQCLIQISKERRFLLGNTIDMFSFNDK